MAVISWLSRLLFRFRREERGAILVEMALVTPFMLTLSAGVFEFGNLIHKKLLIEAGLRDAARYAARCSPSFWTDCATRAANIAATGTVDGTGSARVVTWEGADVIVNLAHLTVSATDGSGNLVYRSNNANVYTVRVSTSFDYPDVGLISFIGVGPITITAAQEERYMGW